jgi:hypothetical protein
VALPAPIVDSACSAVCTAPAVAFHARSVVGCPPKSSTNVPPVGVPVIVIVCTSFTEEPVGVGVVPVR